MTHLQIDFSADGSLHNCHGGPKIPLQSPSRTVRSEEDGGDISGCADILINSIMAASQIPAS